MNTFPTNFRFAIAESKKSSMSAKVGACLVVGKSILKGFNKDKTHTKYANPNIHERLSIHAELDCLNRAPISEGGIIYVYREVHGKPAIARPCEHCISFLKKAGITEIYYSIPEYPYWKKEVL
jgi:deoxycytidylate deaminase